jgi:hypothetical protein
MSNMRQATQEFVLLKLMEGERAITDALNTVPPTDERYPRFDQSLRVIRGVYRAIADKPMQEATEALAWLNSANAELRECEAGEVPPSVKLAIRYLKQGCLKLRAEKDRM